ncbi:hypothetical protein BDV25DRAFT_154332 [Aspergillus avenaceus]|uniref:Pre-mRNA-splicing factor 38B n=1 Tax=Aspergillus avenaceus TaxID=36643 RepID=A0A5N6TWP1_ASPAV|nr:hypothetical protein BDV25DRAFT_154332 [Aspergillus avenaceus]
MPPTTGKSIGDPNSDDYVAKVLTNEARENSLKYSTLGMGAYMPKRPTGAAPKPNTRFLRHIIKETDSHNAALKRKEEREARERMRQLRNQASSTSNTRKDASHRSSRTDEGRSHRDRRDDRDGRSGSYRRSHRSRSASAERDRSHRHRRRRESYDSDEDKHRSSRRSRRHQSYSRSRSRSPREHRHTKSHSHYRRRRSRSPSRSRSRSPDRHDRRRDRDNEHTHDRTREDGSSRQNSAAQRKLSPPSKDVQDQSVGYESDPLEDLVGPLPPQMDGSSSAGPIRSRGRGAYKANASNIDSHFAPDYDPTMDVQLEDDDETSTKPTRRPVAGLMTGDDDWGLALEALRDRARWKQKGEDRLREAGFSDTFVEKWKSNTNSTPGDSEGWLEDVKWMKQGEGREWDRGKYVNDDGHIDVKASW